MNKLEKKKKKVIHLTIILIIFAFGLTAYLVISDISARESTKKVDLSTPENTLHSLEDALFKNSYVMLDKIFYEDRYTSIFGELFFNKIIAVRYGYSNESELNQKRIITSLDFPKITQGKLKYLTNDVAIAILMIDEIVEPNDITAPTKNLLNVAFLIQKFDNEWKITKLYDFMTIDSNFLEIKDFNLHYLNNNFFVELDKIPLQENGESTLLYNFALDIQNISVVYEDKTLCTLGIENVHVYSGTHEFELIPEHLHNPDRLTISGTCDYSSIITDNPEDKYLLYIIISTKKQEYVIRYYGDLLL